MSETIQHLRRKMESAKELGHVVSTMKVLAASNVRMFERAAQASDGYFLNVELALAAAIREEPASRFEEPTSAGTGLVVFGSDQGLVGQFNEVLAEHVAHSVEAPKRLWIVGERMGSATESVGMRAGRLFPTPSSVPAISPLVSRILMDVEESRARGEIGSALICHNRPISGATYRPSIQRLLPLDRSWRQSLASRSWPNRVQPEVIDPGGATVSALILEYVFVGLFRAGAESLASENISRVTAMQTAQQNISDALGRLTNDFHRTRQNSIDEELFDVVSSFDAILRANE